MPFQSATDTTEFISVPDNILSVSTSFFTLTSISLESDVTSRVLPPLYSSDIPIPKDRSIELTLKDNSNIGKYWMTHYWILGGIGFVDLNNFKT